MKKNENWKQLLFKKNTSIHLHATLKLSEKATHEQLIHMASKKPFETNNAVWNISDDYLLIFTVPLEKVATGRHVSHPAASLYSWREINQNHLQWNFMSKQMKFRGIQCFNFMHLPSMLSDKVSDKFNI